MNKAIFFDKDGVLNPDKGITGDNFIDLYPYTGEIIAFCRSLGFRIFVVTNQPVVARGILAEEALVRKFSVFQQKINKQNPGALVDKIYYCPHHPNANVDVYRLSCECRKPKPGMLLQAAREYEIDLKKSFMVGDRLSDVIAGHLAGCKTIHCLTGMHQEKMIETDLKVSETITPDFTIADIRMLKDTIQ